MLLSPSRHHLRASTAARADFGRWEAFAGREGPRVPPLVPAARAVMGRWARVLLASDSGAGLSAWGVRSAFGSKLARRLLQTQRGVSLLGQSPGGLGGRMGGYVSFSLSFCQPRSPAAAPHARRQG